MATKERKTIYTIQKTLDGGLRNYLTYNQYSGSYTWEQDYSSNAEFTSRSHAQNLLRCLLASNEMYGQSYDIDVYQHDNQVVDLDIAIPDDQRKLYGLPDKVTASAPDVTVEVTE